MDETELQQDGTLYPVHLELGDTARITGNIVEEAGLALLSIKEGGNRTKALSKNWRSILTEQCYS